MQCMKCGRDVEAGEVFCIECRDNMEKYPVKPGTVVQLPYRSYQPQPKKQAPRRKSLSLEEQVSLLKRMSRGLALALVLTLLTAAGLGYFGVTQYLENRDKHALGQNYSAASTTEATTAPAESTDGYVAG